MPEQRNAYKGSPLRPWVRLTIISADGASKEVDLLADTGNPCAVIIGTETMHQFNLGNRILRINCGEQETNTICGTSRSKLRSLCLRGIEARCAVRWASNLCNSSLEKRELTRRFPLSLGDLARFLQSLIPERITLHEHAFFVRMYVCFNRWNESIPNHSIRLALTGNLA